MKKYLYVFLIAFCVACTSSNNSEKEYLSVDELNAYQHLMDSISNIGEFYTEPVFMGIKMGQPEKTVVDALLIPTIFLYQIHSFLLQAQRFFRVFLTIQLHILFLIMFCRQKH